MNLPRSISGSGLTLSYIYDALIKDNGSVIRSYVNGIEYIGNTIDFIHTSDGIARKSGNSYYYQYSSKGKQEVYNYEIEIGKNWFEQTFVILKIYNLDKRKYGKKLEPISKDKNYTFDLETSQGQMIRIRKK